MLSVQGKNIETGNNYSLIFKPPADWVHRQSAPWTHAFNGIEITYTGMSSSPSIKIQ
jgi:hypothetical protein